MNTREKRLEKMCVEAPDLILPKNSSNLNSGNKTALVNFHSSVNPLPYDAFLHNIRGLPLVGMELTNTHTHTHTSCSSGVLGRHPNCGQPGLCLKLGMCCFLCVWRVVAMSWLVSYYHPSPPFSPFSSLPTHTHTPLPPSGLGQQPRLQHWDTPFTKIGEVRRGRG